MLKATSMTGQLNEIKDCSISIGSTEIKFKILPEVTDGKGASYNDEPIIGRATPIKTYSHSDNRTIAMQVHFIVTEPDDIQNNLNNLRALQSAVYPQQGTPYRPPPVCKLKCGKILAETAICAVLRNYSVQFPTNVVWDEDTGVPYYFSVSLNWEVVYPSTDLPNQNKILQSGV